jgi:hypothetical protein
MNKGAMKSLLLCFISAILLQGIFVPFLLYSENPDNPVRQAIVAVLLDPQTGFFKDFPPEQIKIKGISADVKSCRRLSGPRRIIMMLDLSPSFWIGHASRQNVSEVARQFIAQRRPEDWLALHVFAQKHQVLVPFTQDPASLLKELDRVSAIKDMALVKEYGRFADVPKSLRTTLEAAKSELRFGDVIVVISLGVFSDLKSKGLEKIQIELGRLGIRTYLFRAAEWVEPKAMFAQLSVNAVPNDIYEDSGLKQIQKILKEQEELVSPTGGMIITPRLVRQPVISSRLVPLGYIDMAFQPEWVSGAANSLMALIHNSLQMEIEAKEPIRKPRPITLKAVDAQEGKEQNVLFQHFRWILPAEMQSTNPKGP